MGRYVFHFSGDSDQQTLKAVGAGRYLQRTSVVLRAAPVGRGVARQRKKNAGSYKVPGALVVENSPWTASSPRAAILVCVGQAGLPGPKIVGALQVWVQ